MAAFIRCRNGRSSLHLFGLLRLVARGYFAANLIAGPFSASHLDLEQRHRIWRALELASVVLAVGVGVEREQAKEGTK